MTLQHQRKPNALHDLGYKIFLDRYAQKDMSRETLAVGDTVIVVVNSQTGQREIGRVTALDLPTVTIELNDGEVVTRDIEHVDKPLETEPGQMMDRVAAGIAEIEKTPELRQEWTDKFRWLLEDWKFVPGGRILTGAGTNQKLTYYNCYVIPSPQDSREGIMNTLTYMTEIMSRGGGVGINLSTLRPRHAYVKGVNGRSSGAVSWGGLYSFVTGLIEQGGSRRGALMLILNDWHPDVFNFISSKRKAGQITNANISVGVSDKLMQAVRNDADWDLVFPDTSDPDYNEVWDGDLEKWQAAGRKIIHYKTVKAKDVWNAIIESAWASAEPGIWFRERSNQMSNSHYFSQLISTNPCLTGDTRLFTDQGLVTLQELFDEETEFKVAVDGRFGFGNAFFQSTRVFMTGVKPVFRLQTREGYAVRATANHRFMTQTGWKELQDLKPGDVLHIMNRKGGFGQQGSLELGRVLGWLVGDGTIKEDRAVLSFFGAEKQELAPAFAQYVNDLVAPMTQKARAYPVNVVNVGGRDEARVQSERLRTMVAEYGLVEKKHQMPEIVFKGTEDMQRGFLQALFTADGSVQGSVKKGASIRLASSVLPLLEQVQLLLSNFGLVSRIYKNRRKEQLRSMPDGKGGYKDYLTKAQHELVLSSTSLVGFMENIGFLMGYKNDAFKKILSEYASRPYPSVYTAVVESITADGEEPVYDMTVDYVHANIVNGIVSHNCGEQPLSAWSVCNLGAINLSRFYDEATQDVNWSLLDRTVRYATRFLDNIIDSTPYFFDQNRDTQLSERRVGLGTMGIAELMIKCKVRYGSDDSVAFIDKVYKAITTAAYETSAQLAVEKGAFPQFDAEKFLQSGFMQQMPDYIREMVRQCGIRNVTLLTQAPTGCVSPNTLVSTDTGLQPITSLGDVKGPQWQIMARNVHTDVGLRQTSHFYINGRAAVKTLTTQRGFSLTATHNHRVRVIDGLGEYVWRRMDEIQIGDKVVLKKNTLTHNSEVHLKSVDQGNRAMSALPKMMTPEFAELLGLYMGDGYTKNRGGLHIVVAKQDPDLLQHVQILMNAIWGERNTPVEDREGCSVVNLTGYYIPRFFEANGMLKPVGNHGEGAAGAFIPDVVLRAGRDCVIAFLRGLYESDGSISRGTVTLSSTSLKLLQQAQIALLGLGIVTTLRQMPEQEDRYGTRPFYELRVLNRRETERFVEVVGFISERKQAKARELGAMSDRGDSIAVPALITEFYGQSKGLPNTVRQRITGLVSNGALTQHFVKEMIATYPSLAQSRLAQLVDMDVFLDEIKTLSDGECDTYDISVPDNHTYIANGFVSHNTTGTMVNASTGIEPFFSWVYYRKSRLGLHEERMPIAQEWFDAHPGETELPDYFVTAMELAPEDHVKAQGAFQRWVDSAISKTCNVPNHYTVEQVGKLYEMMYDLGCKGGTIYRDGSRDEQVLMLKGDERAESEMAEIKKKEVDAPAAPVAEAKTEAPATPHRVYSRPTVLQGTTVSFKTPFGTSYITMNSDEHGNPFEVFITVGKAGSDVQADAEALGRLISLQLRATAPHNRLEMLKLVIDQLQNIGGARPVGFGQNRVLSLPDAVARALEMHYVNAEEPLHQMALPGLNGNGKKAVVEKVETDEEPAASSSHSHASDKPVSMSGADMCPECGTISLVRAEGCRRCLTCDYTEC